MADKIIGTKITADTAEAINNVKSFKQQLKEAQNDVQVLSEKFGATSKEAANAAKRAAELKDTIDDAKGLVDAFNPDTKFRAFGASINTVVGGFTALQGVMGLVGVESEEVQKSLLKVQSALAISQGVAQLQEGVQTFKNLNAVIQQTTIYQKANAVATNLATGAMRLFGAATVQTGVAFNVLKGIIAASGIGLLVVGVGILVSKIGEWTEATDDQTKSQEALKAATDNLNNSLNDQLEFIDVIGKKTLLEAQIAGKSDAELLKIQEQNSKNRIKMAQDNLDEILKRGGDSSVALLALQKEKDRHEIEQLERKLKTVTNLRQQGAAQAKKEMEDLINADNAKVDNKVKNLLPTGLKIEIPKSQETLKLEGEIKARHDSRISAEEYNTALMGLDNTYTDNSKKNADERAKYNQAEFESKLALANATSNILSGLSELFGRQTAAGKIAALAEIATNTAIGMIQGLNIAQKSAAATGPAAAFAFPIFYASQIAAVLGAASKAKAILRSPSAGDVGGGSLPSPSTSVSAPLQLEKPQNQTTSLDANSLNAIGNATTRAFVLETDIQNHQERTTRLNRAARLGG